MQGPETGALGFATTTSVSDIGPSDVEPRTSHRGLSECQSDSDCDPGACCSAHGYCGTTAAHCSGAPLRCRNDSECGPADCCSSWGYCGSTYHFCEPKTVCERDGDCGSGQCCSNANACVFNTYFCSEDDAEDGYAPVPAQTNDATDALTLGPTVIPSKSPPSALSSWPSISPSNASTGRPSIGLSPSFSASPTLFPTDQSSEGPLTSPSASPTLLPSNQTSEGPSTSPSASPTLLPSNQTSEGPSTSPSASPSSPPSDKSSEAPSPSPSASSTLSAVPSSPPSASPTLTKVPRTRPLTGGGRVTECVFPNEVNAEVEDGTPAVSTNLVGVAVNFQYIINADANIDLNATLRSLEAVMHNQLVAEKLDCTVVRRSLRRLAHNRPTAISTLKDDALNSAATCDQYQTLDGSSLGFDCLVIDGGITSYYQDTEPVTEAEVRTEYLNFVEKSIGDGAFNGVGGVKNAVFVASPVGYVSDKETQNGGGNIAGFETVRTGSEDAGRNSLSGGFIFLIVFLCLLVVILIYVTIRCKVYPKCRQKDTLLEDDSGSEDVNLCAESAGDDHSFENSLHHSGERDVSNVGAAFQTKSVPFSDETLLPSNATESNAIVLNDEYEFDGENDVPPSAVPSEGPRRLIGHECADPKTCLVCTSQDHWRTSPHPDGQVEFEPVFDSYDDEDTAESSSASDTKRFYAVEDTVNL